MIWSVYILRCHDGSYYVGHTHELNPRVVRHRSGAGARHTATHYPDVLLYHEAYATEQEAVQRERQIKRWSRAKKEALMSGKIDRLKVLSRSRK